MNRKIFISGGHVTPAIALIDEMAGKFGEVVFVGRKYAVEGSRQISAEYELITHEGIRFLPITSGRLQRTFSIHTIPSLLKVPVGFVQAIMYSLREKPDVVVSFGGYVALPLAVAAWILGIPVVTHEQTLSPGLTNRLIDGIAKRVCVTFKESLRYFSPAKAIVTGLPIRKELFTPPESSQYKIQEKDYPLIYITGGSLGAQTLNDILFPEIHRLVRNYTVIHQTGGLSSHAAASVRDSLPERDRMRYIPELYISVTRLAWVLKHAKFIIGRSGANTTVELAALGKVALLVPLPWSAGNEQLLHAKWLVGHGGALVIEQRDLNSKTFSRLVEQAEKRYKELLSRAKLLSENIPRDGAKRLVHEIRMLLSAVS